MIRTAPLALSVLALTACGGGAEAGTDVATAGPAAPVAPPAGQDWTEVVTVTPDGGHRMGNPDAPVKLLEFASLTCHICADFSTAGAEPLKDYVRSGTVSYELRNFIRDGIDLAASQLTHCVPAQAYFPVTEALFADQKTWFADRIDALNAQLSSLQSAPPAQQTRAAISATGLDATFASRGLSAPAQAKCLADTGALERLGKQTEAAVDQYSIQGTPTFVLNGRKIEGTSWTLVEPALTRAGAVKGGAATAGAVPG